MGFPWDPWEWDPWEFPYHAHLYTTMTDRSKLRQRKEIKQSIKL